MATATYTVSTIAKLLLLTERRVRQVTQEGILPKAGRGAGRSRRSCRLTSVICAIGRSTRIRLQEKWLAFHVEPHLALLSRVPSVRFSWVGGRDRLTVRRSCQARATA
jgi:hypothetical protein